jgi:tRNA/rRNA methyltransferase
MSRFNNLKIILVEPAGALNVGSIARVMKNMELQQLVLVNPHCDPWGEEARRMAVHGVDVLEQAQQVKSLPEALQGCQRAIATTARPRTLPTELESPRVALPWLLGEDTATALIFGPEDRGLSNEELNYAQRFIGIPANPDYPALNLAQAVTICAYELYQAVQQSVDKGQAQNPEYFSTNMASLEILEGYYQQLEAVLLNIGYLYPHTAAARMLKFRRLFNRANLTPEEVAMLRGIFRQIDWVWQLLSQSNSQKGERVDRLADR